MIYALSLFVNPQYGLRSELNRSLWTETVIATSPKEAKEIIAKHLGLEYGHFDLKKSRFSVLNRDVIVTRRRNDG